MPLAARSTPTKFFVTSTSGRMLQEGGGVGKPVQATGSSNRQRSAHSSMLKGSRPGEGSEEE